MKKCYMKKRYGNIGNNRYKNSNPKMNHYFKCFKTLKIFVYRICERFYTESK